MRTINRYKTATVILITLCMVLIAFSTIPMNISGDSISKFSNSSTPEERILKLKGNSAPYMDATTNFKIPINKGDIQSASMKITNLDDNDNFPSDLYVDFGLDGEPDWKFAAVGTGDMGYQTEFNTGNTEEIVILPVGATFNNQLSIRLPRNAEVNNAIMDVKSGGGNVLVVQDGSDSTGVSMVVQALEDSGFQATLATSESVLPANWDNPNTYHGIFWFGGTSYTVGMPDDSNAGKMVTYVQNGGSVLMAGVGVDSTHYPGSPGGNEVNFLNWVTHHYCGNQWGGGMSGTSSNTYKTTYVTNSVHDIYNTPNILPSSWTGDTTYYAVFWYNPSGTLNNGVLQAKAGSTANDDRFGDIWTWDGPSYDPNYGRTVLVRHPIARSWRITDKGDILSPIIQNIAHWAVGTHYTLEDCTLDVGNTGGTKDWENLGQFQGTASVNNFAAKLNQVLPTLPYFEDDYGNQYVDVPLNFTTSTYGSFLLSDLEIKYTYSAVIDKKPDNNNLAIALNDIIPAVNEVNQTGQDFTVYIGVYSDSPCKVKLSELEITYNGAPKCSGIPDTYSVPEDSYDEYLIDLTSYFTDDSQLSEYLEYEVVSYTNHEYVDVNIFDRFYLGVSAEQEPNTNWFGETKVVVSARDSDGVKTKSNMFTVTIAEVNDDPEIGLTIPNINLTTNETNLDIALDAETTVGGTFGYYFTDIDSETLYYKAIVSPAAQQHLLSKIDAGKILNLTAIGDYRLNIPVRIFCDDELAAIKTLNDFNYNGLYQEINVNITTFGGNTPPTWYDLPDEYIPEGQVRKDWLDLRDYVIDMDDRIENLTFSIVSVSNSAYITIAIDSVGIVDILPTPNFDGISKVTLKAEDDEHYYTTESFTVYMIPKNDIPTIKILKPNERDIVAGKVNIEGSAYDIENTLELIELKFGDESDGWVPAEGLTFWKFVWDTVVFAPDTPQFVTIYARAYDGQNYSEHAELDIVVNNQNIDADNDGHPNTVDLFPNDPSEWADGDGDGHGNNKDAFPQNASEWEDTDGDSIGDNSDAFPLIGTEWIDTDGDGYGDNSDLYPNDPSRHTTSAQSTAKEEADNESLAPYLWFFIAIIAIINILTFLFYANARRKEKNLKNKKP